MKKIATFLGFVGVVCLFSGCTSDTEGVLEGNATAETPANGSSNSNSSENGSAASDQEGVPGSSGSANSETGDTVEVTKTVSVDKNSDDYEDPYFSSGIFCWSEECETQWASSSASAPSAQSSSSSAADIVVNMSSATPEPPVIPTVTETQMIDERDGKVYVLVRIGTTLWMAENLRYQPASGLYCNNGSTDMCAEYGSFYTYAAAQLACPYGWRLPTQAEGEEAVKDMDHDWWTFGGRFEINSETSVTYDQAEEQGRYWLETSGEVNSVRIENYSNQKSASFENASATGRAYNVRCVQGE